MTKKKLIYELELLAPELHDALPNYNEFLDRIKKNNFCNFKIRQIFI